MNTILSFIGTAAPWFAVGLVIVILVVRCAINKRTDKKRDENYSLEGMSLGMCFGLLIGTMFENYVGVGISVGMIIGLAIGTCVPKRAEK